MFARSIWHKKLKRPLVFAVVFFVALSSIMGSLIALRPQVAHADARMQDLTFNYIVTSNNLLIVRAYLNDVAIAEFATTDLGVNFGPRSFNEDAVNDNGGPLSGAGNSTVTEASDLPNIYVGERARDAELRGNGYPNIPINIGHPEYVQAYRDCFNRGTPTTDCVSTRGEEIREAEEAANGADNDEHTCEDDGGSMAWMMCPLVDLIDGTLNWLDTQIQRLMEVDRNYYNNPGIRGAFNSIRNIAFIVLVPITLVMVIGTALNFDFVSAYTVKRALPRLIIATIFIALSFQICVFLIEFTNALGRATLGIITAPFSETLGDVNGISLASLFDGTIVTNIIQWGGVAVAIFLLLWNIVPLLMGMIAAFIVLMLRQMFIVVLMLAAPLAILAWIFPGNDRLWKLWWGTFSKLLLMFPLIMAILAMGRIFAFTIHEADGAGLEGSLIQPLMTLIAYLLPYAFIPFTFKFAGGLFATVSGMVNDRSKGVSDRFKNLRNKGVSKGAEKLGENAKAGKLFGANVPEGGRRAKWNERMEMLANQGAGGLTLNRARRRRRITSHMNAHELARGRKFADENAIANQVFANDDAIEAGMQGGGDYQKTLDYLMSTKNYEAEEAAVLAEQILTTRKELGERAFTLTSLAKMPSTGTGARGADGIADHYARVDRAAGNDAGIRGALVAASKSGFASSGRHEVGQASFGKSVGATRALGRAKTDAERRAIVMDLVESAYESGGPAAVVAARGEQEAELFSQVINDRIHKAEADVTAAEVAYNNDKSDANKRVLDMRKGEVLRQKAAVGAIHESIGQAKQGVSKVFGEQVMGVQVEVPRLEVREVEVPTTGVDTDGNVITVKEKRSVETGTRTVNRVQEFQELNSNPEWQQFKREYTQAVDRHLSEQAAVAARMGAVQPGGPQPGQMGGPLGP